MKGAAPVEIARGPKIVPFDGHAHRIDIAVKRTPTVAHFAPGVLFGSALRAHRVQITNVAARNARKVSFPPRPPGPSYPAARPHHTCFEQNPESIGIFRVVRAMLLVAIKRNRIRNLVRQYVDLDGEIELV